VLDLSLSGGDLVSGIVLDGAKGKSNFSINYHDFIAAILNIFKLTGGGI
jgi:hypothetical protein